MKGIKLIEDKKLTTKTTFLVEIDGVKTKFLAKEAFKNGIIKYYPPLVRSFARSSQQSSKKTALAKN